MVDGWSGVVVSRGGGGGIVGESILIFFAEKTTPNILAMVIFIDLVYTS